MRPIALLLLAGCRSILGIDDPSQVCLAQTTYAPTFDATNQDAGTVQTNIIGWSGQLDATTTLAIDLRPQTADFPLMIEPTANIDLGSITDNVSSTCGACVFLDAGLDSTGNAKQTYLVESGRLTLTAASTTMIAGTLSDAVFTPVTIDTNNFSTRIDPQCTTTIQTATFSAPVGP